MRALAVSVILLCVILIYVFSSTAYLSGFFSELLELCSDMPPALDGAEEALSVIRAEWERGKPTVLMLADRSEADGIDAALERLVGAVDSRDEKEYTAAVSGLRYEIVQMIGFITPGVDNVL